MLSPRCILPLALATLALVGVGCKGLSAEVERAIEPVTLEWWRTFDATDEVGAITTAYQKLHPHVTVNVRKFRFEEFEQELLNALAEDRGPDIFSIPSSWVRGYAPKLLPAPPAMQIPFTYEKGKLKKETVVELRKVAGYTPARVKSEFVGAVAEDAVAREPQTGQERVWGLPLAMDTLALYVNRDLLDSAGIPEPPKTWGEFQSAVPKMTKIADNGKILVSGAALGTAENIPRATDIAVLLMMQNGAQMVNEAGAPSFAAMPPGVQGRTIPPGAEALRFYTDFAQPTKETYAWNEDQPNALDAFSQGKVGMMAGYSYFAPILKARAPKLNYTVVSVPQLDPEHPVHIANFMAEVVSRKTKNPDLAWDFVQFAAGNPEVVKGYLSATGKPTALRGLVASQVEDEKLAPYARGLLTAKTWYRGKNAATAESIIMQAISRALKESPVKGDEAYVKALNDAQAKIAQTY